ncbi:MAG: hypothetical protein MJ135_02850 [Oscillospiraceae bacterium]|nr:hypothetical protein [Oscillospiraceae bacterium]
MKKGLKVLLILILIPVVLLGAALIFLAAQGGEYDSPELIRGGSPMSAAQRYSFDPAQQKMTVRLDKADLYWMLAEKYGAPVTDAANRELAEHGLKVKKLGFHFLGNEFAADAKLSYRGLVPLPVHVEGNLRVVDESTLQLSLTAAKIAGVVTLKEEQLAQLAEPFEYDFSKKHSLLWNARSAELQQDLLVLTRDYPMDWLLQEAGKNLSDYTIVLDFVHPEEVDCSLAALIDWTQGSREPMYALVDALAADPGSLPALKADILAAASSYAAHCYFNGDDAALNPRLLPEITEEGVKSESQRIRAEYQSLYDARTGALAACEWDVLQRFAEGSIVLAGGQLKDVAAGGKLELPALESFAGIDQWLDVSTLRVVMASEPGDYLLHQVPTGNTVPVFILRTYGGRPVVAYQHVPGMYKVVSLSEAEYVKYMKSAAVPTLNLGESTTKR